MLILTVRVYVNKPHIVFGNLPNYCSPVVLFYFSWVFRCSIWEVLSMLFRKGPHRFIWILYSSTQKVKQWTLKRRICWWWSCMWSEVRPVCISCTLGRRAPPYSDFSGSQEVHPVKTCKSFLLRTILNIFILWHFDLFPTRLALNVSPACDSTKALCGLWISTACLNSAFTMRWMGLEISSSRTSDIEPVVLYSLCSARPPRLDASGWGGKPSPFLLFRTLIVCDGHVWCCVEHLTEVYYHWSCVMDVCFVAFCFVVYYHSSAGDRHWISVFP